MVSLDSNLRTPKNNRSSSNSTQPVASSRTPNPLLVPTIYGIYYTSFQRSQWENHFVDQYMDIYQSNLSSRNWDPHWIVSHIPRDTFQLLWFLITDLKNGIQKSSYSQIRNQFRYLRNDLHIPSVHSKLNSL
jgi:hypothetical protein